MINIPHIATALKWWRGVQHAPASEFPEDERRACADCKWYSPAPAGASWDRCRNPAASPWDPIRGTNRNPECILVRQPGSTCGPSAVHFKEDDPGWWDEE